MRTTHRSDGRSSSAHVVEPLERRTMLAEVISSLGLGGSEVEIQGDGRFLVVSRQDDVPILVRFNPDGSPDATFASGGVLELGEIFHAVNDIAVQPDGNVLVAGYGRGQAAPPDAALARFLPDGNPDTSFGTRGVVTHDYGGIDQYTAVAVDWNGRILAATNADLTSASSSIIRFMPSGALDASAGPGGVVTTAEGDVSNLYVLPGGEIATAGFAQGVLPDGRRVVPRYDDQVEIYNPNGTLDRKVGYLTWTSPRDVAIDGNHFVVVGTRETHEYSYNDDGSYEYHYHPTRIVYTGDGIDGSGFRDGHAPRTDGNTSAGAIAIRDGLVVATGFGVAGIPLLIDRHDLRQSPFAGTPAKPGTRIEAENFDYGGPDNSFSDLDAINKGGRYRVSQVDVERSNASNGHSVGWIKAGEWLEYTIETFVPGTYRIDLSLASASSGGKLHLEIDGNLRGITVNVPATGSRHEWQTLSGGAFELSHGTHVIRVAMDTNGSGGTVANFDWLGVSNLQQPYGAAPPTLPATIEFEDFDRGPAGIAYHDTTAGNTPGAYRAGDVDVEALRADAGRVVVGDVRAGEWLAYTIVVPSIPLDLTGEYDGRYYDLDVRLASDSPGGAFHVEVDGVDRTGPVLLPVTRAGEFTTVRVPALYLPPGPQIMRVVFEAPSRDGGVGRFDSMSFVDTDRDETDSSFGAAGRLALDDGAYNQLVAFQSDGRIILSDRYGLRRLNSDGTPDPSFAGRLYSLGRQPTNIFVAPDDKILLSGTQNESFLLRLNADGTLDETFPIIEPRTHHQEQFIGLQPDRKILFATTAFIESSNRALPIVRRYFPSGEPDPSFGSLGTLTADFGPEYPGSPQWFRGFRLLPDGRFVLNGSVGFVSPYGHIDHEVFVALRFNPDGSPDHAYGRDGRAVIDAESVGPAEILDDGSILFANFFHASNAERPSLLRLGPDGSLDEEFGLEGRAHLPFLDGGYLSDIAVQANGKALLTIDFNWGDQLALLQLTPDGVLDHTFGRNGMIFHAPPDGQIRDYSVHVRPDGKLLTSFLHIEHVHWPGDKYTTHLARYHAEDPRRSPRFGSPFSVAHRIEAEDFDHARPGVSYHDADAENHGGSYRVSQVDLGPTSDTGGGFAVGWTEPGEWLEYTIAVPRDGLYDLDVRVANPSAGAWFHVEIDGSDVTGPLAVPDTGSFHSSQTVTRDGVHLTQGTHVLRLAFDEAASNGAVGNFNWLRLRAASVRPLRPSVRRDFPAVRTFVPQASAAQVIPQADLLFQKRRPVRSTPIW